MVDGNGKRMRWMGVARIPFLDFDVLHNEVQRVFPSLPKELQERNGIGSTRLYVSKECWSDQ